jgi:hypothetical protein
VRIGTWNQKLCPTPTSPRGAAMASWMAEQDAALWLLTEVHRDWDPDADRFVVSPPRSVSKVEKRWAGIQTFIPFGRLRANGDPTHAGEEGLCLARLQLGESTTVLVACSVLPWRGADPYWHGLPAGQAAGFRQVLDHHVRRITAERSDGEQLIWGGDFNQQLVRPFFSTTVGGADALRVAFAELRVVPLTEHAEHLNPGSYAIDHLAVSPELVGSEPIATVHRPSWDGGQLSDHAPYTADIRLPVPVRIPAQRAVEESSVAGRPVGGE